MGRQIGLSKESIEKLDMVRSNEGISDKSVDLLQFINRKNPLLHKKIVSKERKKGDTEVLHKISGDKFILPVDIQEKLMIESKEDRKWIKEIFAIDYEESILKEPTIIIYDSLYYNEILESYPQLSTTIQKLVYRYLKHKSTVVKDALSQETLKKLIKWIQKFDNSPIEIFDLFKDEKLPTSVSIYREIALMSEKDNNIEVALYFMKKAKVLKDNGTLINKKIEEYEEILREK
jgi:hypothetical protein